MEYMFKISVCVEYVYIYIHTYIHTYIYTYMMCMCAICVKEIHVFECGLVFLCMLPVYGPMADTVEVKLPICKYIYIYILYLI